MNKITFSVSLAWLALVASTGVHADAQSQEFNELRAQMQALSERLDRLEQDNQQLAAANAELQVKSDQQQAALTRAVRQANAAGKRPDPVAAKPEWTDTIALKGDFRLRHESIDVQGQNRRNRDRLRARLGVTGQVNKDVKVVLGLASGSDDPVSSNQTLGDGGSTKDMNLDLAYFSWSGLANSKVTGGKFKNVFYKPGKHGLLWDSDWNPEGLALQWSEGEYFANLMGTWLESDSKNQTEFAMGAQFGMTKAIGDSATLTTGFGFFNFDTQGKGTFYGASDDFFGNSFNPLNNTYLHDYQEVEVFADLAFKLGAQSAGIFVDFVQNRDAKTNDTGYAAGFRYGATKARGDWSFSYAYQNLEADAAYGLLVNSDFGGGGTDVKGHLLNFGIGIDKNWSANITWFMNQAGENAGREHDYDRLQFDLGFKY